MTRIFFTVPLRVDSQFLHLALANLCAMSNKSRSYRVVEMCAPLAITVGLQFAVTSNGSHRMGADEIR